jgi:hypothetical protein
MVFDPEADIDAQRSVPGEGFLTVLRSNALGCEEFVALSRRDGPE